MISTIYFYEDEEYTDDENENIKKIILSRKSTESSKYKLKKNKLSIEVKSLYTNQVSDNIQLKTMEQK